MDDARERLRAAIPDGYSGRLHFAFTTMVAVGVIAGALLWVQAPSAAELTTVPVTFLYANLVEWLGHRGPMHRPMRGLRIVYQRHAIQHHAFFTAKTMRAESPRDFKWVLFPPVLVVFFFGLFALPVALALAAFFGRNVAALFTATAMAYFLCYEWLHLAYHFPRELPLVGGLRRHHAAHHDPDAMAKANFNITFPICDALFGTRAR
jgi:sterol desaturase/sphingolipid hydroxylase (fatty acid hydroxylase superfamily)